MMQNILDKLGLSFDELSPSERETYESWLKVMEEQPLNVDDIKNYIEQARESVELELVDEDEFKYVLGFRVVNRKHVGLKARLKNYILLLSFLASKDKAKKSLESHINNLTTKKFDIS